MKAVAKGQMREPAPAFEEMGTLRRDGCGVEFAVFHDPAFANMEAAEQQAKWLEKVLAEEHEREQQRHLDGLALAQFFQNTPSDLLPELCVCFFMILQLGTS